MKKIVLAMVAALLVAGTAFAGTNSGRLEVGVTYGNISEIDKNNNQNHGDIGGWGFMVGYYEPIIPFFGVQANAFLVFPGYDGVSFTTNGTTVKNTNVNSSVPLALSGEIMLALNIPIAIFDLRAGAGFGYTLYAVNNYGTSSGMHQLSVPVFASFGVRLGSFGVKAGCDIQFVFAQYQSNDSKTEEFSNPYKNYINVFPYVAATFAF